MKRILVFTAMILTLLVVMVERAYIVPAVSTERVELLAQAPVSPALVSEALVYERITTRAEGIFEGYVCDYPEMIVGMYQSPDLEAPEVPPISS